MTKPKRLAKLASAVTFMLTDVVCRRWLSLHDADKQGARRVSHGPYNVPVEQQSPVRYSVQRERAFRAMVKALNLTDLDWGLLPTGKGACFEIFIRSNKHDAWKALAEDRHLPDVMVVQAKSSTSVYLHVRKKFIADGAGVLGRPRTLRDSVPQSGALHFSLYARDGSRRAMIGPEAGVTVHFADTYDDSKVSERLTYRLVYDLNVPYWVAQPAQRCWVTFPIDVVYTWVDGSDPDWQATHRQFRGGATDTSREVKAADTPGRFASCEEIRYSLRSLAEYAGWVRHVWIVTAGQRPSWLVDSDWITIIDHKTIFPDESVLPTFNSIAIEACLHRIPGLSDNFLYLNDDVFLGAPVTPEHFFASDGRPKIFISKANSLSDSDPSVHDLSPDVAAKNGRALIEDATSVRISYKYLHAPHALNKKLMADLENQFPSVIARTRASRFRSLDGVVLAGWFHHSYALATERAVPSSISYWYIDLDRKDWAKRLRKVIRRRPAEVFCTNTVYDAPPAEQLERCLADCFPWPGDFERKDSVSP